MLNELTWNQLTEILYELSRSENKCLSAHKLLLSFMSTISFAAETTPPTVTITSKPANYIHVTSVSFSFSAVDASGIKSIQCSLDGSAFSACVSPKSYSSLAQGAHKFNVKAIDLSGNSRTVSASFNIDLNPPVVTFTKTPPSSSTSTSAIFEFTVTDKSPIASVKCSIDSSTFVACTSPKIYENLVVGSHVMKVQARDAAANTRTISYSFAITAPSSGATITELRLANNNLGGAIIMPLIEGSQIDLSKLPTLNVNIEAIVSSSNGISKVNFILDSFSNTEMGTSSWLFRSSEFDTKLSSPTPFTRKESPLQF